jgi:hypothetical protein
MDSERSNIEGCASAATCTCGDDLARNGGFVHNYRCPLTPKCPHMVSKIDPRTGETIQAPCGSRLEPKFACHTVGCPCLPLCPHCGTPMDRRGVHSIGCPNRPNYSFEYPGNFQEIILEIARILRRYHHDEQSNLLNFMRVIPLRNPVSSPSMIDCDFEIKGQCSICHDDCEQSQRVLKPSECDHCFHADCMTPWIQDHPTCPNCHCETQTILRKN